MVDTKRLSKLYDSRIDFMMRLDAYGRKCLFIYPPIDIECSNCILSMSGKSSGQYKEGGPIPFSFGTCPVCYGKGIFQESQKEEDIMIVLFDANQWFEPAKVAAMPNGTVMVIGDRTRTWDKLVRSHRIILNTDVFTEGTPFRLKDMPYPVGLFNSNTKSGSRYFYSYLLQEGAG